MITNLLASVVFTLVTNVTERFPTHSVTIGCPDNIPGCLVNHVKQEPDKDPQKKWVRTVVKKMAYVSFRAEAGTPVRTTGEVYTVSDNEVEYELHRVVVKDQWVPVTNSPPVEIKFIGVPITDIIMWRYEYPKLNTN